MKFFYLKTLFLLLFVMTGATVSADNVGIGGIHYAGSTNSAICIDGITYNLNKESPILDPIQTI